MSAGEIRRWIGAYVLILTVVLGGYFTLASGTWLLPFESGDVTSASEIVLPFLLGQVVLVYKFYTGNPDSVRHLRKIPAFFVKAPLIAVSGLFLICLVMVAIGGYMGAAWTMSASQFKAAVTFAVAMLNSSTIFISTKYFETLAKSEEVGIDVRRTNSDVPAQRSPRR